MIRGFSLVNVYSRYSRANYLDDLLGGLAKSQAAIATVDEELGALAASSSEDVKELIGIRGTDFSRSQGRSGRVNPDRADGVTMQEAVSYRRIPKPSATVYIWEFGWFGEDFMQYFLFQEEGFRHWVSGKMVPAMNALRDADTQARVRMAKIGPTIMAKANAVLKESGNGWV